MYHEDYSLFPGNQQPLIINAAPYGPTWLPGDASVRSLNLVTAMIH